MPLPAILHDSLLALLPAAPAAFSAKERDTETGLSVTSLRSVSSLPLGNLRTSSHCSRRLRRFGARYYSSDLSIWLAVDPMVDKYPSSSPYVYCTNNPVRYVDPDGEAWKPTMDENTGECTGYEWIAPENSYMSDGKTLKDGLYEEAIFFSDNGSYNPNSRYNIGSSTATVYKADGTTATFAACTYPSDASKFATVPAGSYVARIGEHHGTKSSYMALKLQGKIDLGMENPAYDDHRTYAIGIDIHKAGINNYTGLTRSGAGVSQGCLLIDVNRWNEFMNCFSGGTSIGVAVSRTMSSPTNTNVFRFLPSQMSIVPDPVLEPDKTRTEAHGRR